MTSLESALAHLNALPARGDEPDCVPPNEATLDAARRWLNLTASIRPPNWIEPLHFDGGVMLTYRTPSGHPRATVNIYADGAKLTVDRSWFHNLESGPVTAGSEREVMAFIVRMLENHPQL